MRILQLIRAPIGGAFRQMTDLAGELSDLGHEVGVVFDSSKSDTQTSERLTSLKDRLSLGIHRFPIQRDPGITDFSAPWKIRGLTKSLDIDIIHGHGAKGGYIARLAGLGIQRTKSVYTPHGGVLHFSKSTLSGRIFFGVERLLLNITDAVIFECEFAKSAYSSVIATPSCLAPTIYNGLSNQEFESLATTEEKFDFGYVGELRDIKGIPLLIDALKNTKHSDGRPATLLVGGDGPQREEFEKYSKELGLSDRIKFVGVTPARTIFSQVNCLVMPTYAESLPYAVMEASAAELPVIATNVGGIKEIFGETSSELVQAKSLSDLQNTMQDFLDNPELYEISAARRRKHILRHFTLSTMTKSIEAVYLELHNSH